MSISIKVDTRGFERGMRLLQKATRLSDQQVITGTTRGVIINLVRFTFLFRRIKNRAFRWLQTFIERKAKGRARLGWWPAWKALAMKGAPFIGNGPLKDRGEGGIINRSNRINRPHITVFNEVPYIRESGNIEQRAVARQAIFLKRAIDRAYRKLLRRHLG